MPSLLERDLHPASLAVVRRVDSLHDFHDVAHVFDAGERLAVGLDLGIHLTMNGPLAKRQNAQHDQIANRNQHNQAQGPVVAGL